MLQLHAFTVTELIATVGYVLSGEILVDRFRPYLGVVVGSLRIRCGAKCDNPHIRSLTRPDKRFKLEGFKFPFCHDYAGLIGSHLHPVHEKNGHRRGRAIKRLSLDYVLD